VRFARLIFGASAPLGWPSASASHGDNLSPSWLLRKVMPQKYDD
jgi:hypothetical protein